MPSYLDDNGNVVNETPASWGFLKNMDAGRCCR